MNETRFNPFALLRAAVRPLDPVLLVLLAVLLASAHILMQSASPERVDSQLTHFAIALLGMWALALLKPQRLLALAVPLYVLGVLLLIAVDLFGEVSKGAQRWLDLGVARIQPSELMKIAMPLMLAWFFQQREAQTRALDFCVAAALLVAPVALILIQPDLGTSLLVAASGLYVIFFAGLSWKLIIPLVVAGVIGLGSIVAFGDTLCQPEVDWQVLREYQKQRVCTLLDPTRDPLG
ncbi:MAG TPA: FtsW/RodA/SpoVE family cell cycle protein, partial [Thauera sp.]|nr:FtsW/RodA/SpoVE family cell cycle protein [Thauera sp.]